MTFEERLDRIKALYKEGGQGNTAAVQEAYRLSEQLGLDYPNNPLAEAYHGSIVILIARDKKSPLDQLKWAKTGLKLLDNAVAAAPHDSRVRYLRGRSANKLPEKHFQRTRTVIEDYTYLINQELRQEGHIRTMGMGVDYPNIAYELGEANGRIGRNEEAAGWWSKLEQQTQDPQLRELLKQKLQSLAGKPAIEHIRANDSTASIMIGNTAEAVGIALLKWFDKKTSDKKLSKKARKVNDKARRNRGKTKKRS
ncbi:hypothetical protein [Cohnella sp. GCM10027633]|uniref:hypothetical protein n=1 Tax=unclassified Cohnella TaxID=2636738 RepID=UPI00363C97AA